MEQRIGQTWTLLEPSVQTLGGILKLFPNGAIGIGNRKTSQRNGVDFKVNDTGRLTKAPGHGKILKYQEPDGVCFFRFERLTRFPLVRGIWSSLFWERNETFTEVHLSAFLEHHQDYRSGGGIFGNIGKSATFEGARFGPGTYLILQKAGTNGADAELGIPGVLSASEVFDLQMLVGREEDLDGLCRSHLFHWFLSQPPGMAREEALTNLVREPTNGPILNRIARFETAREITGLALAGLKSYAIEQAHENEVGKRAIRKGMDELHGRVVSLAEKNEGLDGTVEISATSSNQIKAFAALAVFYQVAGDLDQADKCLDIFPRVRIVEWAAHFWNELGSMYEEMKDAARAEGAYLEAMWLDDNEAVRRNLVGLASRLKENAAEGFDSWKAVKPGVRDSLAFNENGVWGVENDDTYDQSHGIYNMPLGVARVFKIEEPGQEVQVRWPHKTHAYKFVDGQWWYQERWR